GVLSGAPPLRRALRQLAIGWGAAAATYALGLAFGTTAGWGCRRGGRARRRAWPVARTSARAPASSPTGSRPRLPAHRLAPPVARTPARAPGCPHTGSRPCSPPHRLAPARAARSPPHRLAPPASFPLAAATQHRWRVVSPVTSM